MWMGAMFWPLLLFGFLIHQVFNILKFGEIYFILGKITEQIKLISFSFSVNYVSCIMTFCLCCKSFSPTAPNKIPGLRILMFPAVVILFCTVWRSKSLLNLALCCHETKTKLINRVFVKYIIIFGSSFMCIYVQEPLRMTICCLIWSTPGCAQMWRPYRHITRCFPELHRPWISCSCSSLSEHWIEPSNNDLGFHRWAFLSQTIWPPF